MLLVVRIMMVRETQSRNLEGDLMCPAVDYSCIQDHDAA